MKGNEGEGIQRERDVDRVGERLRLRLITKQRTLSICQAQDQSHNAGCRIGIQEE